MADQEAVQKYKKAYEKRCNAMKTVVNQFEKACEREREQFDEFLKSIENESAVCKETAVEVFKRMSEDVAEAKRRTRSLAKKEFNASGIKEGIKMLLN
ncbi:hypothetical protein BC829DRAFT_389409 [Chytridium lagenaria]|nr:hypothetical protein BC829DRAFT_389409 [Chytridium lagenaria]